MLNYETAFLFSGEFSRRKLSLADGNVPSVTSFFADHESVHWRDLEISTRCHPEYENEALCWIEKCLGYIPEPFAYTPDLAFIQALVHDSEKGIMSSGHFIEELIFHAKNIRNADMKKGGWIRARTFHEADYQHYNTYLDFYKHAARDRLSELLGYKPSLEHSLDAEIYLRQLLGFDDYYSGMPYCSIDFKAMTVVKYREALLQHGQLAADNSDLHGWQYQMTSHDEPT